MLRTALAAVLTAASVLPAFGADVSVTETADEIRIYTDSIEAAIRKQGYVSGVAARSFLDKKTGFRDAGFGLDIVDWLSEPGSDQAYRARLDPRLVYEFNNAVHGRIPKRIVEGPQICTQARALSPRVIRGRGFVAIQSRYQYNLAAPGKRTGSQWRQTLVFPEGKRYFLASDAIVSANAGETTFLRTDLPGHIRHTGGDTFSEIYLSYFGRIPAAEFRDDFPPDARFRYRRGEMETPRRFIRAYRLRDPATGRPGPWLAGMTLDPAGVYEAWSHQRGYVCMIQEIGGRRISPGQVFRAAYVIGYFDSIDEMERVYDQYAGHDGLYADERGYRLLKPGEPSQPQPDARLLERLQWFRDQKFGLFLHWGIYSQLGVIESWPLVWADRKWSNPSITTKEQMTAFRRKYFGLSKTFNPTAFDPSRWAAAAKRAGMRYVVFTTKHHDGFSMFDTRMTDYRITAPEVPFSANPRANIARAVFEAFRSQGFGIGAYFSKSDWHSPYYWRPEVFAEDRNPNYDTVADPARWAKFVNFVHGQVRELVTGYGKIDILWLDGGQVAPPRQDIDLEDMVAMARRYQPDLIVVNRAAHGWYEDYRTPEQQVPPKPLLDYPWESCITMGTQWSFKPNDTYKSARQLMHMLVDVVAKGGNLLLNIGPGPDGRLPDEAVARLEEIGRWMATNGQAIYGTRPVAPYREGPLAFTSRGRAVYVIYLSEDGSLPSRIATSYVPAAGARIRLLGSSAPVKWHTENGSAIFMSGASPTPAGDPAYVFEITR